MTHDVGAARYIIENPNCMNRLMQWFRDDEVSTILKVSAVVLAVFALVGVGLLVADPIVALLVTVLPSALFGLWALREHCVLNRSEVEPASDEGENNQSMNTQPATTNTTQLPALANYPAPDEAAPVLEQVAWAFGGADHRNQLPTLSVPSEAQGQQDYPDFFQVEHLSHPIMQGKMNNQRPFIAIRVKDAQTAGHIGVVTFFQRYSSNTEDWCSAGQSSECAELFMSKYLELKEWKIVHQIVVERNHPRFTLV